MIFSKTPFRTDAKKRNAFPFSNNYCSLIGGVITVDDLDALASCGLVPVEPTSCFRLLHSLDYTLRRSFRIPDQQNGIRVTSESDAVSLLHTAAEDSAVVFYHQKIMGAKTRKKHA